MNIQEHSTCTPILFLWGNSFDSHAGGQRNHTCATDLQIYHYHSKLTQYIYCLWTINFISCNYKVAKFEFVQKLHGWFILTRNIRLIARVRKLLASSADYLRVMARLRHVSSAEINLSESIMSTCIFEKISTTKIFNFWTSRKLRNPIYIRFKLSKIVFVCCLTSNLKWKKKTV